MFVVIDFFIVIKYSIKETKQSLRLNDKRTTISFHLMAHFPKVEAFLFHNNVPLYELKSHDATDSTWKQ